MNQHHRHAPSSLGYKEVCPAWSSRQTTNAAAEEGTAMHAAMETDDFSKLDEEQAFACAMCRDFRDAELAKLEAPVQYRELTLNIAGGLTRGTADFVAVAGKKALLMDWKFGRGAVEPASTNAQGCAYSLGVFEKFPEVETVDLHFVQPRAEVISSHTYSRADVPLMRLRIETIIRRANAKNREENPGAHCIYCRKQATCAALRRVALPLASRYAGFAIPQELHASNITDPRLMAQCVECAKVLKDWCESVNFQAIDMAANGVEIPGFRLATRRGRRSIGDALAAYGAVQGELTPEAFIECCGSVSLDALTEKISALAPRGEKQKSKDDVISRLTEEGIISTGAPVRYLKRA